MIERLICFGDEHVHVGLWGLLRFLSCEYNCILCFGFWQFICERVCSCVRVFSDEAMRGCNMWDSTAYVFKLVIGLYTKGFSDLLILADGLVIICLGSCVYVISEVSLLVQSLGVCLLVLLVSFLLNAFSELFKQRIWFQLWRGFFNWLLLRAEFWCEGLWF